MRRHLYTTVRTFIVAGVTGAALISPVVATARVTPNDVVLHRSAVAVDLRSPDAATPVTSQPVQTDLRSPDAALPVRTPSAPAISQQPQAAPSHGGSSDGFDFGSAAVGAGIALLIALGGLGTATAVGRRRGHTSIA